MATPKFERQTFFQGSNINTGAADVANELGRVFQAFGDTALAIGQETVRRDVQFKKVQAAADEAHIASAATDIEVNIDYAKQNFSEDLDGFMNYVNASSKGTFKGMTPGVKAGTQDRIKKTFGLALNEVTIGENTKLTNQLKVDTGNTVKAAGETGANAARNLDQNGVLTGRQNIIDSMPEGLYTKDEVNTVLNKYDVNIRQEQMVGNALKIADEQGYIAAYDALQTINETGINGIHPDEVTTAVTKARQVLDQQRTVTERQETLADEAAEKVSDGITEEFLARATDTHSSPNFQQDVLNEAETAFFNGQIDHAQFTKIRKEIEAPQGHDSVTEVEDIYSGIYDDNVDTQVTDDQIADARAKGILTPQKATELRAANQIKKNRIASGGGVSAFNLENKNAFNVLKIKLGGLDIIENVMGQNKNRIGDAIAEYNERIKTAEEDGVRPLEIANDIATRFSSEDVDISSFPKPRFGSKQTEQGVQESKEELFLNQDKLSPGDFRREVKLLNSLEQFYSNKALGKQ